MKKPWEGRFEETLDKQVEDFTASVHFDQRLALYDIKASMAHAKMLGSCGIISKEEAKKIIQGLNEIQDEIIKGRFVWKKELEDVHMNIERALQEKIGELAGKLHTARSRNDQVATDVRLYLREEVKEIITLLLRVRETILKKAEKGLDIILPGFTHLQHAQPVLWAHHLLAYYEMFKRDTQRLAESLKRINICPLGSAALAGTIFPIDRFMTAKELGFEDVTKNSMDAVSDRDFILEFMAQASICFIHLSRLMEEIVLWISSEFAFIDLPDRLCTGSSIMPQKKNPDVAELIRGKTGRMLGNMISLFTVMKGLPLTYNRDLQEDKEALFDSLDTLKNSLLLTSLLIEGLLPQKEKMLKACEEGFLTATDLADYLVTKGVAFRKAHHIVGEIVSYCSKKGYKLWEIPWSELCKFSSHIEKDVYSWLSIEGSVERRKTLGGTSPITVRERLKEGWKEIKKEKEQYGV